MPENPQPAARIEALEAVAAARSAVDAIDADGWSTALPKVAALEAALNALEPHRPAPSGPQGER